MTGIDSNDRVCVPGELLYSVDEGYAPGNGTYEIHGKIRSGLAGAVFVTSSKPSQVVVFLKSIGIPFRRVR